MRLISVIVYANTPSLINNHTTRYAHWYPSSPPPPPQTYTHECIPIHSPIVTPTNHTGVPVPKVVYYRANLILNLKPKVSNQNSFRQFTLN